MVIDEATADIIAGATECISAQNPWETPCELQLSPQHHHFPGTSARILLIRGDREGIENCIGQIYEKVISERQPFGRQLTLKLAVPNSSVSVLMGKEGLAMAALNKLTGCHIWISKRVENIEQCILTISGKLGKPMMRALLRICEKLQMNKDLASHHCFTPCIPLPLGVWDCSDVSHLAEVDHMEALIHPDDAKHMSRRDIVEYLLRVKQQDAKDFIKTKRKKELVDVVAEAWKSQGGQGPVRKPD